MSSVTHQNPLISAAQLGEIFVSFCLRQPAVNQTVTV